MSGDFNTPPRWILSFADLLSVILSFFVLMYAMSIPADQTNTNYDKSYDAAFSVDKTQIPNNIEISSEDDNLSTNYLYQIIEQKTAHDTILSKLKYKPVGENIIISLESSDVNDKVFKRLAQLIKTIDNDIRIYSSNLDKSHEAAQLLEKNNLDRKLAFFESKRYRDSINIVIYP